MRPAASCKTASAPGNRQAENQTSRVLPPMHRGQFLESACALAVPEPREMLAHESPNSRHPCPPATAAHRRSARLEHPTQSGARLPRHPQSLLCFFQSEEHTSELQSLTNLVCRLLLEKKKQ